jgi:peptidyl-prolyl cis-trans isomerase D
VETAQGWHIVSVVREERPELGSFDEVRESLRAEIAAEKAREQYVEQLVQLEELAYTSADLAAVAERMALEPQVSAPLRRHGGEGLGAEPKVIKAAFSEPVLKDGYASSIIELDDDRALVVELQEHRPPTLRPLDQVRPVIVDALESEQATALARERAARLREQLETGVSIADVAAEADLEWHAHLDVGRYDRQFDRTLLEQVFAVPASRTLPATGVLAQHDGVAVYQVKAIHPGNLDAVPVERRRELRSALAGARASQEFNAYQALVLATADVEIAKGATEALP